MSDDQIANRKWKHTCCGKIRGFVRFLVGHDVVDVVMECLQHQLCVACTELGFEFLVNELTFG